MANNITLDQIKVSSDYDLQPMYNDQCMEAHESPLTFDEIACNYYDPEDAGKYVSMHNVRKNFSIFSLNCRSLPKHWDQFKHLMAELSSSTFAFDIIGLCEIFDVKKDDEFILEGYSPLITNTRRKHNLDDDDHGGVGIYIKNELSYKKRPDISIFIPHVIETIFIEIQLKK